MLKLYSYCRSSTSYRVRIGLHLKGLVFETVPVNLLKSEQRAASYLKLNPSAGVPVLEHDGFVLGQSLAILNYIDNLKPEPPLAGGDFKDQAFARQVALTIACEIHPLINLKVMDVLKENWGPDAPAKVNWYMRWTKAGMDAVETLLRERGFKGPYAMGDAPGLIDICVVPHMYNMRRNKVDLSAYPICSAIEANCLKLDAFIKAAPENQPDAPEGMEVLSPLAKKS